MPRILFVLLIALTAAGCSGTGNIVQSTDGIPIAYTDQGSGEPALVLVHGWSCDSTYWREQVGRFAAERRVVTVDLAGHGDSGLGRLDYTMEAFGVDVAAVVTALDLPQVILVGHSMGATVVLEAAARLPGRVLGMVAVDALQEPGFGFLPLQVEQFLSPMQQDFGPTTDRFVRSMFAAGADTALVAATAADMAAAPTEVAISAMRNLLLHDPKPTLARLGVPLVCLVSERNPVDEEAWRFYRGGYRTVVLPDVGHFPQLERPEEFDGQLAKVVTLLTAVAGLR